MGEIEFQYNLNRRDLQDIGKMIGKAEDAYNFAVLEAQWNGHMIKNGIVGE